MNDFYKYFRSLASEELPFQNAEMDDFLHNFDTSDEKFSTYIELDEPITQNETRKASVRLNTNKACSLDTVLNEYLKESIEIILNPLEKIFNYTFSKQSFPNNGQWELSCLFTRKETVLSQVITGGLLL